MSAAPSTDAVRDVVAAFESLELPFTEWTHRAHLTVAAWYVLWYGPDAAVDRVRERIQRYNAAHGVAQTPTRGYHETITRFYVWLVARRLERETLAEPLAQIVNRVVDACEDREIPFAYYSRERLTSWDARTSWIEPDLRPLDETSRR
jgi:hypothetical protein